MNMLEKLDYHADTDAIVKLDTCNSTRIRSQSFSGLMLLLLLLLLL